MKKINPHDDTANRVHGFILFFLFGLYDRRLQQSNDKSSVQNICSLRGNHQMVVVSSREQESIFNQLLELHPKWDIENIETCV